MTSHLLLSTFDPYYCLFSGRKSDLNIHEGGQNLEELPSVVALWSLQNRSESGDLGQSSEQPTSGQAETSECCSDTWQRVAEDKRRRKIALQELDKLVFQNPDENDVSEVWENVHQNIVRMLNDPAEACRELSIELVKKFLDVLPPSDRNIIYVIPVAARRLGSQEIVEPSEEVRLNFVSLLRFVVEKYKEHLPAYLDDFILILSKTVTDNYPNVKKESCACISELAKAIPRHFYNRSENLVKPILTNFTHQHYKVRAAAVNTIGDVVQYGNNKSIEEVATPMAERLFDQSGAVRMAVVQTAGRWLMDLRDRYSWWHKLIPLLLTGLHDEIESIRNESGRLWVAVGEQYIAENDNDDKLKDKLDFLSEEPEHYPPNIKRPNLGCRTIAQQNLCKLIGGIGAELGDWMADIRVRSAQLLCVLVLNVEQDVTQHIEKILPPMYRACNDEDKRVVANVELAAEYMGYFVPPDVYCHLVLPTLEENPTSGHLRVFSAILRGSSRKLLVPKLEKIGDFMQQSHICRGKKLNYQQQILSCCKSLMTVCEEDCRTISQDLFTIIFTVLSLSSEETVRNDSLALLNNLTEIEELKDIEELYKSHLRLVIKLISCNPESWTIYSPEFLIFQACLVYTGPVASQSLDLIISVLRKTMSKESDPELRLKQFLLLSNYLIRRRETLKLAENLTDFISSILDEIIVPSLVWSAGRVAEALRTAAVGCLCAALDEDPKDMEENDNQEKSNIVETKLFPDSESFLKLYERVMPILITLADDNARKTRLYSLRAIAQVMTIGERLSCLRDEHIHQTYYVVLRRLDDGSDEVRFVAVKTLGIVWAAAPKDYDKVFGKNHVDALYTSAIVHLDDPDPKFQEIMLEAMKPMTRIHPDLLIEKIHRCRGNFRNQEAMDTLLEWAHDFLTKT